MKKLLLVVPIIILGGCNGAARNPQIGSMVHPETDLTQFPDEHLLRYYYFFTQFVANQERDIHLLETGRAGLVRAITRDLGEYKAKYEKNRAARERILAEINRRGLPLDQDALRRMAENDLPFGIAFGPKTVTYGDPEGGRSISIDIW